MRRQAIFKPLFFVLFSLCHSASFAQRTVSVTEKVNEGVTYLQFQSDSCSATFINQLNKRFGYSNMLIEMYNQAPNEALATRKEIIERITKIRKNEETGALASIDFEVNFVQPNLLSFTKIVTAEGERKVTNSLHTSYPELYPFVYDLKAEKEIKNLNSFLTREGVAELQKKVKRLICKRAKNKEKVDTIYDCRIGQSSASALSNTTYFISNDPRNEEGYSFFFYFTQQGMELDCNALMHEGFICDGISAHVTIPWFELKQYCVNKATNVVFAISTNEVSKPDKTDWKVRNDFANILDTPDPPYLVSEALATKPYLVKGERVVAEAVCGDYLKIKYVSSTGKEIRGWIER